MKILLTAFEPFGGYAVNPTQAIVERLAADPPLGVELHTRHLPVVASAAVERALAARRDVRPDAVVSLGLAVKRDAIGLERVAVNLDDFRIPDNAGVTLTDAPIVGDGPAAYWTTLPVRRMERALRDAGVPVEISYSAGTYVCNHLFYALRHAAEGAPGAPAVGFIHVPKLPEQGTPSLPLDVMTRGVRLCLEVLRDGEGAAS
jgi:pyroglutamyl-peptidase